MNSLLKKNILERQQVLLEECKQFFGTLEINPIYSKVEVYELIEICLKMAKAFYPEGINPDDVLEQDTESLGNLLDPNYEGSIAFAVAQLLTVPKSIIKKRPHEQGRNYLLENIKELNHILNDLKNSPADYDFKKGARFFFKELKTERNEINTTYQKLSKKQVLTPEEILFNAQTARIFDNEFAKQIAFEELEEAEFQKFRENLITLVVNGHLNDYLDQELNSKLDALPVVEVVYENSSDIVQKGFTHIENMKNSSAKNFVEELSNLFKGRLELNENDVFLNKQINSFWRELNALFTTSKLKDYHKVNDLPKEFLDTTLVLLKKLNERYERKLPKLLQEAKKEEQGKQNIQTRMSKFIQDKIQKNKPEEINLNDILKSEKEKVEVLIGLILQLISRTR